jgi:hypothetical protein
VRNRVYVPPTSPSLQAVLESVHDVGHEGSKKTLHRLRVDFHISGARTAVQNYVRACIVCQRNKSTSSSDGFVAVAGCSYDGVVRRGHGFHQGPPTGQRQAGDRLRQWVQRLPWAEFCYNSLSQTSLHSLPFKVVYG